MGMWIDLLVFVFRLILVKFLVIVIVEFDEELFGICVGVVGFSNVG